MLIELLCSALASRTTTTTSSFRGIEIRVKFANIIKNSKLIDFVFRALKSQHTSSSFSSHKIQMTMFDLNKICDGTALLDCDDAEIHAVLDYGKKYKIDRV